MDPEEIRRKDMMTKMITYVKEYPKSPLSAVLTHIISNFKDVKTNKVNVSPYDVLYGDEKEG